MKSLAYFSEVWPKTAVVMTYPVPLGSILRIVSSRHVFTAEPAQERRQDARLLEHRREQAPGRRPGRATPCAVDVRENSSQAAAWRKAIEVFDESTGDARTLALFPEDRCAVEPPDAAIVKLRLSEMRLCRPRQWAELSWAPGPRSGLGKEAEGACWLAGPLWQELQLDRFWAERLPPNRKGTRWDRILQVLVTYRLIAPGSEWRLHREWFSNSAMADLLGSDFGLAEAHKLYACHDHLLAHKAELFSHLVGRWRDLFNADFDVLLYDLTSTYFEINAADVPEGDKRRHGYSRDKRSDCPQVVIALVVTPEGLPLAYEVLSGNTVDCKTLRTFLSKIERQYGKARRVWIMDRGIPTEAVLAEMRASEPAVQYLVGTRRDGCPG